MSDRFSMPPMSLEEMLASLAPDWSAAGAEHVFVDEVCIDSRQVSPGSLFVALRGENVDGHDYVAAALSAGARIALVERPLAGLLCVDTLEHRAPDRLDAPLTVRVASTLTALQTLAAARRRAYERLRVIGITGSIGKTTTKEAVASVLAARYSVLKSGGNRNNEIGLPLTLLTARADHQLAVLEMGMYQLGEIAELCRIASPDAGIVTNVAPVHLERLGTIERIAQAKAELVRALPREGWAALNADDPRVAAMAELTRARVVTFGEAAEADVRVVFSQSLGLQGNAFALRVAEKVASTRERDQELRTRMLGPTAVRSVLAGVTAGLLEGLSWDEIQRGLDDLGQGLRLVTRRGREGSTILDDCYNASPDSVRAALALLEGTAGRRIAVLGDMLELGAVEAEGHRQVGRVAARSCDVLVTVGQRALHIARAAAAAGLADGVIETVPDNDGAIAVLDRLVRAGDVVLVKGSRGMAMEEIVSSLLERTP